MKSCSKCKVEKPLDEFYAGRSDCKPCKRYNTQNWRENNLDRERSRKRDWYSRNSQKEVDRVLHWASYNRDKRYATEHRRRARIAAAVPQRWQKSDCSEQLCYWCGVDLTTVETHVEHLMPISLGGEAKSYNEAPACKECNLSKGDKHPLVWLARMF